MSTWVLNISKYGDSTACPNNWPSSQKSIFLPKSLWNFLYFNLCLLSLILPVGTKEKSLTLSALLPPIKYLVTDKIPLSLLSSQLSSPSLRSLCSSEKWSNHLIISLWAFDGLAAVCPYWGAQHWTQCSSFVWSRFSREEGSSHLTCWKQSAWCSPG